MNAYSLLKEIIANLKEDTLGFPWELYLWERKRVHFLKVGKQNKSAKLELVQIDVCCHASVSSLGNSNYYATIIDDATRKTWVYWIQRKSMHLKHLRNEKMGSTW